MLCRGDAYVSSNEFIHLKVLKKLQNMCLIWYFSAAHARIILQLFAFPLYTSLVHSNATSLKLSTSSIFAAERQPLAAKIKYE
jgi:hypothetical protein